MVFILVKEIEYNSIRTEIVGVYSEYSLAKKAAQKLALEDVDSKNFNPRKEVRDWSEGYLSFSWDDVNYSYLIEEHKLDEAA